MCFSIPSDIANAAVHASPSSDRIENTEWQKEYPVQVFIRIAFAANEEG